MPYVGHYYEDPSAKLWDGVYKNNYKKVEEAFKEGADVNIGGVLALLGDKKISNDMWENTAAIEIAPNLKSFLPKILIIIITAIKPNVIEWAIRGIISIPKNWIQWSKSKIIGNNPDNIAYLKLKLAIPIANPHTICPKTCSNEIPLTSSGFPTMNLSGRINPNMEKPIAIIP